MASSVNRAHKRIAHFTNALNVVTRAPDRVISAVSGNLSLARTIRTHPTSAPVDLYRCWRNLKEVVIDSDDKAVKVYETMIGFKNGKELFDWCIKREFESSVSLLQLMMTLSHQDQFLIAFQKVIALGPIYQEYKKKLGIESDSQISLFLIQEVSKFTIFPSNTPKERIQDLLYNQLTQSEEVSEIFYRWIMDLIIREQYGQIWKMMCTKYEAEIASALAEMPKVPFFPELCSVMGNEDAAIQFIKNSFYDQRRTPEMHQFIFSCECDMRVSPEERAKKRKEGFHGLMVSYIYNRFGPWI